MACFSSRNKGCVIAPVRDINDKKSFKDAAAKDTVRSKQELGEDSKFTRNFSSST